MAREISRKGSPQREMTLFGSKRPDENRLSNLGSAEATSCPQSGTLTAFVAGCVLDGMEVAEATRLLAELRSAAKKIAKLAVAEEWDAARIDAEIDSVITRFFDKAEAKKREARS